MSAPELPRSIAESTITLLGVELKCHVLDDGRRIFEAESFKRFLCALGDPDAPELSREQADELARFVKAGGAR